MKSMKDKKIAFFDMDGLLLDTEGLYYQTRKQVLARYGFTFTADDHRQYIAKGFADTRHRLQRLVHDDELGQRVFDESMALYHEQVIAGDLKVKPGATTLLQALKAKGVDAFVTSSASREVILLNVKQAGLTHYFVDFISGDEVTHNKPAPDIYLHALETAGAAKKDVVVFEDATSGIESAYRAGLDIIVVPDWIEPDPQARSKAVAVMPNLGLAVQLFE